ncbi:hypothetical protein [Ekhidna sp. To15]|uniref:hypothetical protein n=1 Tax=Ekhidna sp. To15 TaxID=3395267 RepID=UPI003F51FF6B
MNRVLSKRLLKNLIGCMLIIGISLVFIKVYDPYEEELDEARKRLRLYTVVEFEHDLNITVGSTFNHRGTCAVELNDSTGFFLKHSRNYNYSEPWLNRFLESGDKLMKNKNSDTLWIERSEKRYFFILGEFIGE